MNRLAWILGFVVFLCGAPSLAGAQVWHVDPVHSSVTFKVRHFVTHAVGRFQDVSGVIRFDPQDLSSCSVEAVIQAASIDTDDEKRDRHLRSEDFFDVETYPTITFTSTEVKRSDEQFLLFGDLTMRGVTRPVTFEVQHLGTMKVPWGGTVAGFSATATINRRDFGIVWNKVLDTGKSVLGTDVTIQIEIEAGQATPE